MALRRALLLGVVQGPTEVLPVSSSAHIALLARAAGQSAAGQPAAWRDPELRNALEVALHAGAAAALLIVLRDELAQGARELDGRRLAAAALALAPPALAGYLLEQRLEHRANRPRALAAGLALGAAAMAWADVGPCARRLADLEPRDGLALGLAQALALLPGVSRNGATLTAARARGFAREDAHALSWRAGVPVLAGATALKAYRLGRRQSVSAPPGARWRVRQGGTTSGTTASGAAPLPAASAAFLLTAGAGAAFLSTLACAPLLRHGARRRPLWPFALYRAAVAVLAWRSSGSA